jgi:hypothetical protein
MKGYWTLPQALTWQIYGRELTQIATSVRLMLLNATIRSGHGRQALTVRDAVHDSFKLGTLVAYGIPTGKSEHVTIPPTAWLTMDVLSQDHPNIPAQAAGFFGEIRYYDVRVRGEDMQKLWPRGFREPPATEEDAREAIRAARAEKGADLTVLEAEKTRAENCAGFPRKEFRQLLIFIQGRKEQGRPRKV